MIKSKNNRGRRSIFEVLPFLETKKTRDYIRVTDLVTINVSSTSYL